MNRIILLSLVLTPFIATNAWAQTDTVLFNLQSEVEFTDTYFAYSGVFDQEHPTYLYAACKDLGLLTFFISVEGHLTVVDTLSPDDLGGHQVSNVFLKDSYLYVALGAFQGNGHHPGLGILNIENPAAKEVIAIWDTTAFAHGSAIVRVDNDIAFLGAMDDGLLLLDVSNKTQPQFLGQVVPEVDFPQPPGLFTMPHTRGLAVAGDVVFLCQDAGGFRSIDISTLSMPVEEGQYVNSYIWNNAGRAYNNAVLHGDLAFIGVDYCGVEVLDISQPESPQLISHYNPWDCGPNNWQNGSGHVNELVFLPEEELLFVSAGDSELLALDASNPADLKEVGRFGFPADSVATWGLAADGHRIALFQIDNAAVLPIFPQPFYSDFGGVRLLEWERITTSTATLSQLVPLVRVSPNPFNDVLTVTIPTHSTASPWRFELFNLQGQLLLSCRLTEETTTLGIKDLANGLYLYQLSDQNGRLLEAGKVVRQN